MTEKQHYVIKDGVFVSLLLDKKSSPFKRQPKLLDSIVYDSKLFKRCNAEQGNKMKVVKMIARVKNFRHNDVEIKSVHQLDCFTSWSVSSTCHSAQL